MNKLKKTAIIAYLVLLAACGGSSGSSFPADVPTKSPPVVSRVAPATGAPDDAITIYGLGFSSTPTFNIVIVGGAAVAATSYSLVDPPTANEVESITATIPADANVGADSIAVMVHDEVSNADITFTVQ
ncbi:MAG: IPT/TIG domain-containing protein [Pseudomonadota bacterium]